MLASLTKLEHSARSERLKNSNRGYVRGNRGYSETVCIAGHSLQAVNYLRGCKRGKVEATMFFVDSLPMKKLQIINYLKE